MDIKPFNMYIQGWTLNHLIQTGVDTKLLVTGSGRHGTIGYRLWWALNLWLHAEVGTLPLDTCRGGHSDIGYMQGWALKPLVSVCGGH